MADGDQTILSYQLSQEARVKFDYFVAGITGAMIAYLIGEFEASKLGVNEETFDLVGILSLMLSFYFGFRRIEYSIVLQHLQTKISEYTDRVYAYSKQVESGELQYDSAIGSVIPPERAGDMLKQSRLVQREASKEFENKEGKFLKLYKLRNHFLMAGFLVLLVSKISGPYLELEKPVEQDVPPKSDRAGG